MVQNFNIMLEKSCRGFIRCLHIHDCHVTYYTIIELQCMQDYTVLFILED